MKYFIDFEATQYTSEIISIGCVDEKGREFYTLVKPHKIKKLTKFITELTGITAEDLQNAPTVDEAFSVFYDWIDPLESAEFYCYGYSDKEFVVHTMRYTTSVFANRALTLVKKNLFDFSQTVKEHFFISKDIALKKVVEYYRKESVNQSHNALEDALLLKEVYDHLQDEAITECPFPNYQDTKNAQKEAEIIDDEVVHIEAVNENTSMEFSSYKKAADWVMCSLIPEHTAVSYKTKSRVCNRIKRSIQREELYFGYKWNLHNQ